ncbi:MAG TPA: hypothetical protein VGQ35_16455 [Dongiaceae bacterium]|nr:hypothetical protein [Dongiaceae bacterium]
MAFDSEPMGIAFFQLCPSLSPAPDAVNSSTDFGFAAVLTWVVGTVASARKRPVPRPINSPPSVASKAWRLETGNGEAYLSLRRMYSSFLVRAVRL